jgi:hypothetical protein
MQTYADGTVSFRSAHGKYLVAEPNGSLAANRDAVGPWERFRLQRVGEGAVVLRSAHGKFLSAEPDGRLTATREQAGAPQRFFLR